MSISFISILIFSCCFHKYLKVVLMFLYFEFLSCVYRTSYKGFGLYFCVSKLSKLLLFKPNYPNFHEKTPRFLLILCLMLSLAQSSFAQRKDDTFLINLPAQNGLSQAVIKVSVSDTNNVSSFIFRQRTQEGLSDIFS